MKKVYPYALTLALLASGAVYGSAQSAPGAQPLVKVFFQGHDHDRDHRRWEEAERRARETGYQDGLHDGRWDFDHHRHFRLKDKASYKRGDHGYEDRFGDRHHYQEVYRKEYERGYREGYHAR